MIAGYRNNFVRVVLNFFLTTILFALINIGNAVAGSLKAGVAKVNITNTESGEFVNDSLYVKALVLDNGSVKAVIVTVDAVAIGGIGSINDDYLDEVRSKIEKELNIKGSNVIVNASHLHGAGYNVCHDIAERTFQAVKKAGQKLVPVNVGVGRGHEDRITENRRLRLKGGKVADIRHAYPMPSDEEVVGINPADPEIGIMRMDKNNGETLAVVYNFTGHPYLGVPGKGTTADYPGIASKIIEDNLDEGTIALFIQGFGGDTHTVLYKDVDSPPDAEVLGNMLGLNIMEALDTIKSHKTGELKVIDEVIKLPRRTDFPEHISLMKEELDSLLRSLLGTSLNFNNFLPLYIKYNLLEEYPSYYSHRYLHDEMIGREGMKMLDAENRRNIYKYLRNIYAMDKMSRLQENISLLQTHQKTNQEAGEETIDVEVQGIRVGDFVLVTFPGEVSAEVGFNIKEMSPFEHTYLAGFTNGYIYYAPTVKQYKGHAQEDTDCLLAPEWQKIYEEKVMEILKKL